MDKPNAVTLFNGTFYEGSLSIEKGADFTHDSSYSKLATLNASKAIGDGRIEFVDAGVDMVRKAERAFRQGNLDETSLGNITVINLLQEVVRRQYRDYHAIEAMKRIPVPKLQLDVPISDKYTASKKVGEFVEPDQKTNKFTVAELRLFKNMVSIYESDESQLKATIEPLSYEIDQASGALAKAANEQIVAEIETATTAAKGDWGAMTTNADFSARNPLDDITDVVNTMQDLHFRPDTICMHPRVSSDYLSNTFINGYNNAVDRQGAGTYPLPKFPGLKTVSDLGFTSTTATVLDSNTMLLGEGPMVAEQFRNPLQSADGWVIRQWLHPLLVSADGSRKMTGVSA
jgi:hypothetical protein